MKRRFTENDDVLNAIAAVDPNSQFLLSTEMLTVLAEKYSSMWRSRPGSLPPNAGPKLRVNYNYR